MTLSCLMRRLVGVFTLCVTVSAPAEATEWFVATAGQGDGTSAAPFGRIQDALAVAQPGDTITVRQGTFTESLRTVRNGTTDEPIRLRAARGRNSVIVTAPGRVMTIRHAFFTVEGLVLDGQYGLSDTIQVASSAHDLTIRDTEVRRSTHDLIDIAGPSDVLIENCLLHHALNAADGRTDAHGRGTGPCRG